MDRMAYSYQTIGGEKTNRLDFVQDYYPDYSGYEDIKQGQTTNNYQYNKIGELVEDVSEDMTLNWRYGDHKCTLYVIPQQYRSNIGQYCFRGN